MEVSDFLHGILQVTVFEAHHLHNALVGPIFQIFEKLEEALHLPLSHSKVYATVDIGAARVARTRLVEFHPQNPVWNESFRLYVAHASPDLTISVKNQLPVGADELGRATIATARLLSGESIKERFELHSELGNKLPKASIQAQLQYFPVRADPCWDAGIRLPQFTGIRHCYFPQRTSCNVTLYQNSHLSNEFQPDIRLTDGSRYVPPRAWEDLYTSINDAQHFVYVAGWSVNTQITLVRDRERMIPGAEGVTVGELLKRKAEEGVTVLVMVWQDHTSISFLGNAGLMGTHDEETFNFFEGSKVRCFLCSRDANMSLTAVEQAELMTEFTHHQKSVTLDVATADGSGRHVVSFIGGIDICDGRYDDEKHTLFHDLDTTYRNDFMQNNYSHLLFHASLEQGGPREPWHDVHSRLEGQAAWDVLTNFEQRWKKQAPPDLHNSLFDVTPDKFPDPTWHDEQQSWNVQASEMGLVSGKDVMIDQSIHVAYIEAIRRARRFIYIENQYFLGSCAAWKEDQDSGCLNLIPIEIALKIASKIKKGERFAAYIVTPMWPEGLPEGGSVQAILRWTRLTMEMMYEIVAKAIEEAGLKGKAHPSDYLNFFCLGNREALAHGDYVPPDKPEEGTDYSRAQINRRFMIYVHAKLMIVDDEYVIVGSANLNQRSLAGNRDTEIAHGSYQQSHLNGPDGHARGQVYAYRMALWYEHFMSHCKQPSDVFLEPESLECVRTVREVAETLWEMYTGDAIVDLLGHLLPFPIKVSDSGELSDLPENGFFPDTNAKVKGETSLMLPPLLTT
ncbi:phospholipase D alpha 1-like protein [Carex littledalei]|uniref:Phospholipase D n=1 Tax=Carex littledalei TaxID=544730 RepID=A0A833RNM9_9POAL|nr:phospholipase D alpha 1-like protein [Carex littledalei]